MTSVVVVTRAQSGQTESTLVGRGQGSGAGATQEITLGTNLSMSGATLNASGGGNAFGTIAVSGQSNVVADTSNDTLTLVAGTNVTITTDAATDTVTIAATGGGNTAYAPGSVTVADGTYRLHVKRLQLTGSQRLAVAGSGRFRGMN